MWHSKLVTKCHKHSGLLTCKVMERTLKLTLKLFSTLPSNIQVHRVESTNFCDVLIWITVDGAKKVEKVNAKVRLFHQREFSMTIEFKILKHFHPRWSEIRQQCGATIAGIHNSTPTLYITGARLNFFWKFQIKQRKSLIEFSSSSPPTFATYLSCWLSTRLCFLFSPLTMN